MTESAVAADFVDDPFTPVSTPLGQILAADHPYVSASRDCPGNSLGSST